MNKMITNTRFNWNPETMRLELQVKTTPTKTVQARMETDDHNGMLPVILIVGPESDWVTVETAEPAPQLHDPVATKVYATEEAVETVIEGMGGVVDTVEGLITTNTNLMIRLTKIESTLQKAGELELEAQAAKAAKAAKKPAKKKA